MDMTFTSVAIKSRDEVFLAAAIDEYADESPDHCMVLRYSGGAFKQLLLDHAVCAIAISRDANDPVFFVGPHGKVTRVGAGGLVLETIDDTDAGPSALVLVRDAGWIGPDLYACGMARMVYRRDHSGHWQRIDGGVFVPREARTRAIGFHAIGGVAPDRIYCVGQYGEIWFYDGARWAQEDSPANVALTGVCVRRSGEVVVVGMAGVLLVGKRGGWQAIDHRATESDFWGIAEFKDYVYVANYDGVFRLAGIALEKVALGVAPPPSTAYLAANDDVLWSVGHKHALYTIDGVTWTAVTLPS